MPTYRQTIRGLKDRAHELGATGSKVIDVKTIKTAPWVRYKCQFGCSGFGETLTCPPRSLTFDQTQKILDSFHTAILVHCHNSNKDISDIVVEIEKEAFLAGYYKALGMGAGPCRLCKRCNLKGECRHPEDARPSMEACGIDVFSTVRNNGYQIDTIGSTRCQANYFGIVLIK